MSIGAQTALALGRALLIALVSVAVSGALSGWLAAQRGRARTAAWLLLLLPFFTPSLLISYALSRLAMSLVVANSSHEALYVGTLFLKLLPVAVVLRALLPSPLSAESAHSFHLLASPSPWKRMRFCLRAAGPGPWIAGGLAFLLAFADFELASLWSMKTWTMAVFDAQIGGLALRETLRLASGPLMIQFGALTVVVSATRSWRNAAESGGQNPSDAGSLMRWGAWIYLAVAATFICIAPLAFVAGQAVAGIPRVLENFVLGRELGVSVLFALASVAAASVLAALGRKWGRFALLLAIPGLLGGLIVSLLLLALFQTPMLRALYDTPLPLALALTILLLPLALLLTALWCRPTPALHVARQVGSRRLIWELETRPRALACGLLFCWAYFDLTASSILAPTGFTPVFVRLHNLAHYGQNSVLSAMMIAAFATPIVVLLLTGTACRLYARGHGR